ncbi:uncharacterized protein C20orf96, partial [Nannospalax galili]|uniref:uncharacterized protein C20orf96 n=1 Tax=Nannospalax galili TaxID=1026970 RepID=UPI0004ED5D4D
MTEDFQQKYDHSGTPSAPKLQLLQWSEYNWKQATLPPFLPPRGHRSKMKTSTRPEPAVGSQFSVGMTNPLKNLLAQRRREPVHHGKVQAKVRLMRLMLWNKRAALQELYSHEGFLSKLSQELIEAIQDVEDSMAVNGRMMLQQQGILE